MSVGRLASSKIDASVADGCRQPASVVSTRISTVRCLSENARNRGMNISLAKNGSSAMRSVRRCPLCCMNRLRHAIELGQQRLDLREQLPAVLGQRDLARSALEQQKFAAVARAP